MEKENDTDSLARMVAEGFAAMEKRFDRIDDRFDVVESRFDAVEKEVRVTNERIDKVIRPELDEHARRIKTLESEIV